MLHLHKQTIAAASGDVPSWHRGRDLYALWLIEADTEEVRRRVLLAREHLSGFLIPSYRRQPHITVFVCGFLVDTGTYDDDYLTEEFERHAELLRKAALRPFPLEIGALNSFASAPFLAVADRSNGLGRVRSVLMTTGKEIERSDYIPHVTVGLYADAFPSGLVTKRIASFSHEPCTLRVDRITFATFRAAEMYGALTRRHEVPLVPR
jgi:2'-5' RNA ligase